MEFQATVDCIFEHLLKLQAPIAGKRRKGLDLANVTAKLAELSLQGPADLLELYSICDGTETPAGVPLDDVYFFPGYYWLKLDSAIQTYRSIREAPEWNDAWLPILASGGGDFYAVICDETSPDFGCIVGFLLGQVDQVVEYKNIKTMFQIIERSFTENAFFVADGYLDVDYPKMAAIAKVLQPDFIEHDA